MKKITIYSLLKKNVKINSTYAVTDEECAADERRLFSQQSPRHFVYVK